MSLQMLFANPAAAKIGRLELLEHDLNKYFPELLKFQSTASLAASPIIEKVREDAERILNAVVVEQSEPEAKATGDVGTPPVTAGGTGKIAALAWNIERGIVFDGIIDALQNHNELNR